MRLLFAILLAVSMLSAVVHGWSKDDYEIFDLVSDLEAAEGKGTNFYSHLNIDSSASTAEINKAYRKKSLALHPDKNPGVKDIQARFARLGVISQILRSPEKRERYNFFYKNGVPTWRGTGYYYSRFRPTLTHTLLFLVFLTSLFHLLVLKLNFNKDRRRVDYFHREALKLFKNKAGKVEKVDESMGGSGVGRRVRVNMTEGGSHEYTGAGTLELVVVDDKVFLPHDDEGYYTPLSDLATPPSYFRTWPFLAVLSGLRRITPFLPPSVLDSIPESLRPHEHQDNTAPAEKVSDTVDSYDPSAPLSKKDRKASRRSIPNTPKDSPATTDLETDGDDDELADGTEGEAGENGKGKKKKGLGKSGAARRRKMAMKK